MITTSKVGGDVRGANLPGLSKFAKSSKCDEPIKSVLFISFKSPSTVWKLAKDIVRELSMPLKTEPLEEPSINLTSMLDIVMLLIVFFMVATKFSEEERQTDIQVPTAADNVAFSSQPDDIIVNVSVEGKVRVRDTIHTLASLKEMLAAAHETYPGQSVLIRGDGRVDYQTIMDVISTCKSAGIKKYKLAHVLAPKGN
jgi:biopolymer transport protein ExbD